MLPAPKPGLQNVLCAYHSISFLSTTLHKLLPANTRPIVHVHAACERYLVTANTHIVIESPFITVRLPQRLHFRPLDIAIRASGHVVTVVVAGADGALFANLDISCGENQHDLCTLPGSAGYAIVSLAINDDYIAAAAVDGRIAIWRSLYEPAQLTFDNPPLSGDRVTDMKFVQHALLVAWWSGRLTLYELSARVVDSVVWTMDAVCVSKHVFAAFSGCYLVVRGNVVALSTGRGDLVFVRLADGGYCKGTVGEYVKGLCEYDEKLHLVVDGKLVTREWMSNEQLDEIGVMTSVRSRNMKTEELNHVSNGG